MLHFNRLQFFNRTSYVSPVSQVKISLFGVPFVFILDVTFCLNLNACL